MIFRILTIATAFGALAALWFGYHELGVFRRTVFWEYRYIIFAVGAFVGLSLLEWGLGWLKGKVQAGEDTR